MVQVLETGDMQVDLVKEVVLQGPEWYKLGEQWLEEQGRTVRDIYG